MAKAGYVALLRGINVGGRNIVRMADLRTAFEESGFASVRSYIQSGNVLFESDRPHSALESDIEAMMATRFGLPVVVVVRSRQEFRQVVEDAPDGFGTQPDTHHSDVIFLKPPLTEHQALEVVDLREGVDQVWPGDGVLYFARLSERLSQSRLSRIAGTPHYQNMTIRNWNTTTRLLNLLDDQNR